MPYRRVYLPAVLLVVSLSGWRASASAADLPWSVGMAKVDITPIEPVRLSGYGNRNVPSEGVDTPLFVRAIALRSANDPGSLRFLISIDSVGLPSEVSSALAAKIKSDHGVARDRVAICVTHTHSGPALPNHLANIFAEPLSDPEQRAAIDYQTMLVAAAKQCVAKAVDAMQPASLQYATGAAPFAVNRRVIENGRWKTFGVRDDGPADLIVDAMRISDADENLIGLVFNYACHCTTVPPSYNRVNADWAGYAATTLESVHQDAIAICTIGCGADANPQPRETVEAAIDHGRTLAAEVDRIATGEMKPIASVCTSQFGYAALSFELPTEEELKQRLGQSNVQAVNHAKRMLDILHRDHRLPATHPVPIQTWTFGDDLSMIFLGGEVVSDYSLRLRRELPDQKLWITAYANDVPGYIASEQMISEGGYEYDRSGVYYSLPGPWASGTEDVFIAKIHELLRSPVDGGALSVDESIEAFDLADGYRIECVAAEPLIRDPVNVAFDTAGRLWVVQMGDYPSGDHGGAIKVLTDDDADGVFDSATTFLDDLSFPTGVMPWRDGVLISVAPNVLFAKDIDGDLVADDVQSIYSGFRLANPQHRINGFSYGLDHSLHLASGDNLAEITSQRTGQTIDASGHDVQIWPDEGGLAATSGRTQFVRSRNDRGDWFGNDNSRPMFHFPIPESDLARNPLMRFQRVSEPLFSPPVAPPIFAISQTDQRFNDLTAAGRFTSACSAMIVRSPGFEPLPTGMHPDAFDKPNHDVAMVCEPVHNLVHRAVLKRDGATYRATRAAEDAGREFLRSTDPRFRPVRVIDGPDGCLYVVDMYRNVIEHPEWIPQAWQQQMDLRGGSDRGRIYRISPTKNFVRRPVRLDTQDDAALVDCLDQPIGALRDLAQQLLIERNDPDTTNALRSALNESDSTAVVTAMWILQNRGELSDEALIAALEMSDAGVIINAIRIARQRIDQSERWSEACLSQWTRLAKHSDAAVVLEVALALGDLRSNEAASVLAEILRTWSGDPWIGTAVAASSLHHAESILMAMLSTNDLAKMPSSIALSDWIRTAVENDASAADRIAARLNDDSVAIESRIVLASALVRSRRTSEQDDWQRAIRPLYQNALAIMTDADADSSMRCQSISLMGLGISSSNDESKRLALLLTPTTPLQVQQSAIDAMIQIAASDNTPVAASPGRDVLDRWPELTHSLRDHCVQTMLQRSKTAETLIAAIEDGRVAVSDLSPASQNQLTLTGSRSMRVRAERLFRQSSRGSKTELIRQYLASASTGKGDVAAGRILFDKHCAVCHVSDDRGQTVGANLANLTDRRDQALLTAILDPNQSIDPKYISYVVLTDDGRIITGVIAEEIGDSITIVTADNRRITLSRQEILEIKSTGISLMPEGFEDSLSPDAMRDLLAHLKLN